VRWPGFLKNCTDMEEEEEEEEDKRS